MTALPVSASKTRSISLGNHGRIYRTLCLVLAGNSNRVRWPTFSLADWNSLVATAQVEGVAPLLCHTLDTAGRPDFMPDSVRHDLRATYYATAAHNLLIYQELAHILAALSRSFSSPCPVILLKGVALAATLYPSIALRPLGDVDLLVPREQLEAAVQLLEPLGYHKFYPEMAPGLDRLVGHHVHLRGGPQQSVIAELHWELGVGDASRRSVPLDWFWEQTEEWKMEKGKGEKGNKAGGVPFPSSNFHFPSSVLQLTPAAHLLYLAAHLVIQHGGMSPRLLWLYDLHLLITHHQNRLNWDELVRRAGEFGWTGALHAALEGAQARFDTHLPEGFLQVLKGNRDYDSTYVGRHHKGGSLRTRAGSVWDTLMSLGWRMRLRLVLGILCPSPAWMRCRYKPRPAWLWPLYYPYRWFDITRDGLSTVWQMVKKRWQ